MGNENFDYYSFSWGKGEIGLDQKSLQSLRMERCFDALSGVKGKVLEVGCGEGRAIRTVKKRFSSLTTFGCDFLPQSIFRTVHYRDGTHYALCDAHDLPYKSNSFDAVVVFDLIEHVVDVDKVISEINRILKDDGIFHCFIPCEINFPTLYWFLWKTGISPDLKKFVGHIQKFDEKIITDKLTQNGFKPVHLSYSYHYFGQLMDILLFTAIKYKSMFNLYYKLNEGKQAEGTGQKPSLFSRVLEGLLVKFKDTIHLLAYYESKRLEKNPWAIGLHFNNLKAVSNKSKSPASVASQHS